MEDSVEFLITESGFKCQEQDTRGKMVLQWAALSGWNYGDSLSPRSS